MSNPQLIVLCCGDREWTDHRAIRMRLSLLPKGTRIIHGACRGADNIAGYEAEDLGFQVVEFPADWEKYGRAAGPVRNQQMLDEGKPTLVLAFHYDLAASKGTADMVKRAHKRGVPVEVIG